MLNLPLVLVFVAMTFLSWGSYGILLHEGQHQLGGSSLRSFIGVGIAYFLIAVVVPAVWLNRKPEKGFWSFSGTVLSIFAGSVGALGALGVLLALKFNGKPIYVMPLVFGFAPVVNTLVTMWLGKTYKQMNLVFVIGLILVALGAVGVLITKPGKPAASHASAARGNSLFNGEVISPVRWNQENTETEPADDSSISSAPSVASKTTETSSEPAAVAPEKTTQWVYVFLSITLAAFCWGAYGPFLHLGQMKMGGSRLRPFFCVGIAYFGIAVAAPLALLSVTDEAGGYSMGGMFWSIAAGAAGAVGALGIIMAFNFGGKPVFVMPLIFGFAPVVNTFVAMFRDGTFGNVRPEFFACLGIVIAGAVTVLIFAPKPKPHIPPATSAT